MSNLSTHHRPAPMLTPEVLFGETETGLLALKSILSEREKEAFGLLVILTYLALFAEDDDVDNFVTEVLAWVEHIRKGPEVLRERLREEFEHYVGILEENHQDGRKLRDDIRTYLGTLYKGWVENGWPLELP